MWFSLLQHPFISQGPIAEVNQGPVPKKKKKKKNPNFFKMELKLTSHKSQSPW